MTEPTISFEGTISESLFVRAQGLHIGRRKLVLPIVAAAFVAGLWMVFAEALFLSKILATIAAIVVVPLIPAIQRRQWKRLYKRSPYLLETIRGEVSAWGLKVEGSMGKSEVPWPKFVKYKLDNRMILLYQGPNIFHLIATEFFATKDDWIEAQRLVVEQSGLKIG